MAILRSRGARSFTTRLPMTMSPLVCFSRPAIMRRSVVLPQPEGPRRTRNSPSRVERSTPSTAVCSWKTFRIAFVSTVAIAPRKQTKGRGRLRLEASPGPASIAADPRLLQQLPLAPLLEDALALVLGFLDGILRAEVAGRRLGEHHVEDPGRVDLVDGGVGVAGVPDVGGPVERVGEHRVLVRGLSLLVGLQQLLQVGDLLRPAGEVVVLAALEGAVEIADVVDEELLRPGD